jgi:hypothetical protein
VFLGLLEPEYLSTLEMTAMENPLFHAYFYAALVYSTNKRMLPREHVLIVKEFTLNGSLGPARIFPK